MDDYFEALEIGIEILVMLQYGASPLLDTLNCSECTSCEKKANGCALTDIQYMEEPFYIDTVDREYLNCPISLIPSIIYAFNDRYNFIKEFNTPITESDTSSIFWWYVKTYNRIKAEVQAKLSEKKTKSNKP